MRRFLIGLAGGATLGYFAVRAYDALSGLRQDRHPREPDPHAYGSTRRRLMVGGMVRSLATLGWFGYALAPRTGDSSPGGARVRRIAWVAGALTASTALDLPADYVESYLVERTYGLTKQSANDWLAEHAKSFALSIAFAVPLVELLAAAIARAPKRWPWLATAGTGPLLIIANLVVPTFILPLFNTFEPLEGPLEQRLRRLADRYGVGDALILRMDMSRQTEKANAFVTGLFGSHRIVLGDTLLEHFTDDEIEFVVAHELGHYVLRDVWRAVGIGTLAAAFTFFGAQRLAADPRGEPPWTARSLTRLAFFASLIGTALGPFVARFSRQRERTADRFALAATSAPQAGIAAFTRLRERNLAEEEQPVWMEVLFSSHPSLRSRITALQAWT